MSFAVVHMKKIKMHGVKGIQFHNQRERESKTNPDIDKSKSYLNYDIHNQKNIDFNKVVKEKIKNNVITDRAIRKDAVVMCNFVITSDRKFFDGLTEEESKDFFHKSYEFFKNRYGDKNIVSAQVHMDENTPHLHISLVPVTNDNKLSAKRLFDRNELRSIQDDYPKYIQKCGFDLERGIDAKGKNKHIETQKFKELKLLENIQSIEYDLNGLKNEFNKINAIKYEFNEIDSIEGDLGRLNKKKIKIDVEDFEKLKNIAKRQHILESKNERLERRNNDMSDDIRKLNKSKREDFERISNLKNDLKEYKAEYDYVVDYLKETNQVKQATDYVHEQRESKQREIENQNPRDMYDYDLER